MRIEVDNENRQINLTFEAKNDGKFRFKKRNSPFNFGLCFSTREEEFDTNTYLEWQIGYDALVSQVKKGEKETSVKIEFTNDKGQKKYPYELSEILYDALRIDLITKDDIKRLISEISAYSDFIDTRPIETSTSKDNVNINKYRFIETSTKLPTLFFTEMEDCSQIDISIEKQQYASGVQPMIYFCIESRAFKESLIGRTSNIGEMITYTICSSNIANFFAIVRVFGMASERHRNDILKILNLFL